MIRKIFKKKKTNTKIDALIEKYKIKREYLSINRKTVSKAMLVGMFFAFIPMPMQMLAVVLCTPFLTFNVPLAVSLVWITNPLTMPFIFYIEYLVGKVLLFSDYSIEVQLTVEWFSENMDKIFFPLYTGAFFTAFSFSFGSYFLINYLWKRSVHSEKRARFDQRK